MDEVEVRCPNTPGRLFMKLQLHDEPLAVTSDNLIELACSDCKRTLRLRGRQVARVLHRYDLLGQLVESEIVR